MLLDNIKNRIDKAEIISFDIFDTLLLRPYVKPVDLFTHIGQLQGMPFFAICRQEAEKDARVEHRSREDIRFEQIYQNIDDIFKPLQEIEISWEERVLRPNFELKQVYDYALSQNKTIVIISDMYLPTDFIAKVLRKNGYDGWERLYVSGDIGLTKGTGNLFKRVLQDFSLDTPKKVLHIGDNKHSDYKAPHKLGIECVLYKQVLEQFLDAHKYLYELHREAEQNLGLSILLSVLAYRWHEQIIKGENSFDYWSELGYLYAGPLAYGYCRFIEEVTTEQKLDFIGFVARDGYTLQKIFTLLCPSVKTEYIYAPRFLNLICRLDYARRNIEQTSAILDYFSQENSEIKRLSSTKKLIKAKEQHNFIQNHIDLFLPIAKKNLKNYRSYISSKLPQNAKIGMVDTITGEFSAQKLLQSALDKEIHGIYWSVILQAYKGIYSRSCFINQSSLQEDASVYTKNWNFIEFLLTSPEYPIKNMDRNGNPIYESNPNAAEKYRAQIYPVISAGAIKFVQDIQALFGEHNIFLDGEGLVTYINSFIENPTKRDISEMSKIKFGKDSNHTDYVPLFSESIPLREYLLHPKKTLKRIKKLIWQTPMQIMFACLLKPISIRSKGIKRIDIYFFPYLAKQFFGAFLNISSTCSYKIIVGKKQSEDKHGKR